MDIEQARDERSREEYRRAQARRVSLARQEDQVEVLNTSDLPVTDVRVVFQRLRDPRTPDDPASQYVSFAVSEAVVVIETVIPTSVRVTRIDIPPLIVQWQRVPNASLPSRAQAYFLSEGHDHFRRAFADAVRQGEVTITGSPQFVRDSEVFALLGAAPRFEDELWALWMSTLGGREVDPDCITVEFTDQLHTRWLRSPGQPLTVVAEDSLRPGIAYGQSAVHRRL